MTDNGSNGELAYWIAVRGIAKKALYAFGTGPLYDFVHGTITRSPVHGENVRAYVREQVEYSSWIVSRHHTTYVLRYTRHRTISAVDSMQQDVRQEVDALLKSYTPTYYRLAYGNIRFVVEPDFDDNNSDDYESPMRWDHRDEVESALVKLETQYKQAKLPLPIIEIVAFNKDNEEVPK